MKGLDIFGIIVRTVGLALTTYSALVLIFAFADRAGWLPQPTAEANHYLLFGLPGFLLGVLMLYRARTIVRLAYRGNRDDSEA